MSTTLNAISVVAAAGALAVAGYVAVRARSGNADLEARISSLEARLVSMEREREEEPRDPTLVGTGALPQSRPPTSATVPRARVEDGMEMPLAEDVEEMVSKAVEKKAAELQVMQTTKKPSADLFAKTLELTDEQRYAAEREIVIAQREVKSILEIPAADGTDFMGELVEVMAGGIAHPGENPQQAMKLFGRLLTEPIPGSDETYAARIEAVKERLRATFRRDWTEKQYAGFEAWRMDPTEVQGIEGSPWKEVEILVRERARALGAEIPDEARGD